MMREKILKVVSASDIDFNILKNKTVLITGASGLIGKIIIEVLDVLNEYMDLSIQIVAFVRDKEKFQKVYQDMGHQEVGENVQVVIGDVREKIRLNQKVDYIIHGASMTQSSSFIEKPVEVTMTNLFGTENIMRFSKEKEVDSVIYISSMEAYGFTEQEDLLTEDNMKYLNPLSVRSCYPESKRMSENLCVSYASEYQVPVKIIRLAQTFGYGVGKDDARVFVEFTRCALEQRDIVLLTDGTSKRMYLDTIDAVLAILTVLLKGENGSAYNAANKKTYCSVKEMAKMVSETIGRGEISVKCAQDRQIISKFSPPHRLFLDTDKIENLGWHAQTGIREMYEILASEIG